MLPAVPMARLGMQVQITSRQAAHDPKAARIAVLSREYVVADRKRRSEIGEEIAGLMSGRSLPRTTGAPHRRRAAVALTNMFRRFWQKPGGRVRSGPAPD